MLSLACFPPSQQPNTWLLSAWTQISLVNKISSGFSMGLTCYMNGNQLPPANLWGLACCSIPQSCGCGQPLGHCVGKQPLGRWGVSAGRQKLAVVTAWKWGQSWPVPAVGPAHVQIQAQHHESGSFLGQKGGMDIPHSSECTCSLCAVTPVLL